MQKQQYNNLGQNKRSGGWKVPWQVKQKTKLHLFVVEASIKTSWKCRSPSVAFHFVFNLVCQPPCHRLISFVPARPGQKGVWAQHELASAGCLPSPAICQHGTNQHFTPTPPRSNWLWRRQKGTWCDGDTECVKDKKREKTGRETKIEAENERKQEGSFLLSILNLPRCCGSPVNFSSCSVKRSVSLLNPDTHTHTHTESLKGTVKSLIQQQLPKQHPDYTQI